MIQNNIYNRYTIGKKPCSFSKTNFNINIKINDLLCTVYCKIKHFPSNNETNNIDRHLNLRYIQVEAKTYTSGS